MSKQSNLEFDRTLSCSEYLRKKARKNIPKFAYEYLIEGCMDDIGLRRNHHTINALTLEPHYLQPFKGTDLSVELFGHRYDAPFGIAPIGLQGLMWPDAPVILAKAAREHNIPYVLSTVSSESLERIADISQGHAWYQLYNPTDVKIRDHMIARLKSSQYKNMMVTVDVPTFGFRPRDFRNGLAMPPKTSLKNFIQVALKPRWAFNTLKYGIPEFKNLKSYMDDDFDQSELTEFMNKIAMGGIDFESLKPIRDQWKDGNLIIKGVMSEKDAELAVKLGADGILVSNHGARQLDAGNSPISPLRKISEKYGDKIKVMMDSGLQSGSHIACALSSGAQFTFLGRFFMYAVAAKGKQGGQQAIAILKTQLAQVMEQIRCESVAQLPKFLAQDNPHNF